MNLAELAVIYSITNATFIKCILLLRENTNFPQHVVILLCEKVTECAELEKRISEETQISLYTH